LADLLFFPTGGGKTEAYLGLAAFTIAHRRLIGPGVLGAGVAVIMRYTLRLLTLDQLARAAGVVCALELMRDDPTNVDAKGRKILGDWPIEIGLWVGSDASPNRLGRTGDGDKHTAVGRVQRYRNGQDKRAPAPLKACPWCGTEFTSASFACVPNNTAPTNMEIRCANTACDFTRGRALPVLTVDVSIYRRLPAFLIATVDKFASLPWLGETGAFFGNVDRFEAGVGFFGAAEPSRARPLDNGWKLDPPALIIQDELHLISGPLGTVAGLYEAAIDQLSSRQIGERRIRPKIIASTATVRRAQAQIKALFDRSETKIFPPTGVDRTDSFFAQTIPSLSVSGSSSKYSSEPTGRRSMWSPGAPIETAARAPTMNGTAYQEVSRESEKPRVAEKLRLRLDQQITDPKCDSGQDWHEHIVAVFFRMSDQQISQWREQPHARVTSAVHYVQQAYLPRSHSSSLSRNVAIWSAIASSISGYQSFGGCDSASTSFWHIIKSAAPARA
jgi:hypothetical protein